MKPENATDINVMSAVNWTHISSKIEERVDHIYTIAFLQVWEAE